MLPWTPLPPQLGALLRPQLGAVVESLLERIPAEVPEYARPMEGAFGVGLRQGVEVALGRFLDLPGTDEEGLRPAERAIYVALGAGELHQGRSLSSLLSAYRVGARVANQRFTALARAAGLPAEELLGLAEAIFVYIDEISAASVQGYADAQSARAGTRDRLRRELVELLVGGGGDARAVAEAAAALGWPLPARVEVVLVPGEGHDELAVQLWPDGVCAPLAGMTVAVVAAGAADALPGATVAIGPARPWREAPESLRLAQQLLASWPAGAVGVVRVDDDLLRLLLHRDPVLLAALAERELAPLAPLRPVVRQRLEQTLLAWLAHKGERARVAEELHVHVQTVGYRLTQLRSLFGVALADPERRFALEVVLRARAAVVTPDS